MTQYLGLILLLLGMGAFFGLWLMMINNRSKIIESQVVHPEPGPTAKLNRTSGYSLAPKLHSVSQAAMQKAVATQPGVSKPGVSKLEEQDLNSADQTAVELEDETAATHLEIAHQFFDMGDFEGAIEMCQLVIENQSASSSQLDSANILKGRCE